MLVSKLQSSSSLSNFYAGYLALSHSMSYLYPIETLVSEVEKAVVQNTNRLEFSTHSTVSEDIYGVVKVTQKHKLPSTNAGSNHMTIKYHLFLEKIYSWECSVNKVDGKDQNTSIFTKDIQGGVLLYIRKLFCV